MDKYEFHHLGIPTDEVKEVLFGPYKPLEGFKVAMIVDDGLPVELIETDIDDVTLAKLDAGDS